MSIIDVTASSVITAGSTVDTTTVRARSILDTLSVVSTSVATRVRQAAASTQIDIISLSPRIIEVSVSTVIPITQNDEAPTTHPTVNDFVNIVQDVAISPKIAKVETLIPLESAIILGQPVNVQITENISISQSTKTSPAMANVIDIINITDSVSTVAPRYQNVETIIPIQSIVSTGGSIHNVSASTLIIVGNYANRIQEGVASSVITITQAAAKVKWDTPSTLIPINQTVTYNTSKFGQTIIPIIQVAKGNTSPRNVAATVINITSTGIGYVE